MGYPVWVLFRTGAAIHKWSKGHLALGSVPSEVAKRARSDWPAIVVFLGVLGFSESATVSPSGIQASAHPIVQDVNPGHAVVINGFEPGSRLFTLTQAATQSHYDGFAQRTFLTQSEILPPDFEPGSSKMDTWEHLALQLMREVKRSGKTIDVLDLHFHGDAGQLWLFQHQSLVSALGIGQIHVFAEEHVQNPSASKPTEFLRTIERERLSLDIFSPGAAIHFHGCQFAGGVTGKQNAILLARCLLGKSGGVALFPRVLLTRDFPETLAYALGLDPNAIPSDFNFPSRVVGAPINALAYFISAGQSGTLSPLTAPEDRVLAIYVEPGTQPNFRNMTSILLPPRNEE